MSEAPAPLRLLLLGASGLVGAQTLRQALAEPAVAQVTAPVRRPLAPRPRLVAPVADFADPDGWPPQLWRVDAVICCLGTTIARAGSQANFVAVDRDLPVALARRARDAGARRLAFVSATGADPAARVFYSRVKGETERDLAALGYESTTFVRPGLLDGDRAERRPLERAAILASRALAPVLPAAWRASSVPKVARALIDAALAAPPGLRIIKARDLA